jgi:hypothetical protein
LKPPLADLQQRRRAYREDVEIVVITEANDNGRLARDIGINPARINGFRRA